MDNWWVILILGWMVIDAAERILIPNEEECVCECTEEESEDETLYWEGQ